MDTGVGRAGTSGRSGELMSGLRLTFFCYALIVPTNPATPQGPPTQPREQRARAQLRQETGESRIGIARVRSLGMEVHHQSAPFLRHSAGNG